MSAFNGPELVAGTILGTRHWNVRNGFLEAPAFMSPWSPGENVARHLDAWFDPNVWELRNHRVAQEDCRCGFYAFYDATGSEYRRPYRAEGVIEGYGLVSVGPLGFRAAKAKVVAIAAPQVNPDSEPWPQAFDLLTANYPDAKVYRTVEAMRQNHPTPRPDFAPEPEDVTEWIIPATTSGVTWGKVFVGTNAAVTKVSAATNNLVVQVGEAQTQAQKFEAAIKKPEPKPGWVQVSPGVHRYIPKGSQR